MKLFLHRLTTMKNPVPHWFGDEDEAVLVDLRWGRIYGHYQHDGHGKWEVWACLSYWRAWRVLHGQPGGLCSLSRFPRCWVWFFRSKSRDGAVAAVEQFVPDFKVLIERDEPEELDD